MVVNGKALECAQSAIHLGVTISSDLRWNRHVNASVKKAAKRLYFLVQLKEQNYLIMICCFIACLELRRTSILSISSLVSEARTRTDTRKGIVNYLYRDIEQPCIRACKYP